MLAVTGVGFALQSAPTPPVSISPGQSITFKVIFSASAKGSYSGLLGIGARQFQLTGTAIQPALELSMQVDVQPLTSQQQAHISVQSSTAAGAAAIGQLTMTFVPAVTGISDDPSIVFSATGGRQIQVTIAQGSQTGTFNGQSPFTFQTGTTAGTITFTLVFPNQAPVSKAFTIVPATVQITSGKAVVQAPSLVVTLSGFDNTYSAGMLSFTFFDKSGKPLTAAALSADATTLFHQYFFNQSKTGGAFSVQTTFPVTGDITQVGSVKVGVSSSSGTSTATETFQ